MKRIIEVDLFSEEDIFEKYNKHLAKKELIDYIINEADPFDKKENIVINFNNMTKVKKEDYLPVIKNSLLSEFNKCSREIDHNNLKQFVYLLIGVFLLFISTIFGKSFIFEEIFLIGGWVLIWETIEIEIFADTLVKKRKAILKKLINSELIQVDDLL